MPKLTIRPMIASDIDRIVLIDTSITGKARSTVWKAEIEDHLAKFPQFCLVAEENGDVVGFMIGSIREWMLGLEKTGWIETLGVHPDHMGKRIGTMIGRQMLQSFAESGIREVYTAARWDSGDLLAFFKALGFDRSPLVNLCVEVEESRKPVAGAKRRLAKRPRK